VKSDLFKNSLKNCFKFKIVTDIVRYNEENKEDYNIAGAKFLQEFKTIIKNYQFIDKIEYLVFSSNKKGAYLAL
jgi:hypothetical protein